MIRLRRKKNLGVYNFFSTFIDNVFVYRSYLHIPQHFLALIQENGLFLLEEYYLKLPVLHVSEILLKYFILRPVVVRESIALHYFLKVTALLSKLWYLE